MNPVRNRVFLACVLALAAFAGSGRASAEESIVALPPLKVLEGLQDGTWWHVRKVSPEHPVQRDGSESGCVTIADYVQATINLQRPAGMRCGMEVLKDRARAAELQASCVPAAAAEQAASAGDPDDATIHYTLKRAGDDEIQLQTEQGRYRYSSRFMRIGECGK